MTAVAKQPANGAAGDDGLSSVVVIAAGAEDRRRVGAALAEQALAPTAMAASPEDLVEVDVDASTVVVFVCDVDAPREIASLRRLERDSRQPAIVVISPRATGTGVRRALDAGADGLVFESDLESALATAVRAVAAGQSVVPRKLRASVEKPVLSYRERQVLTLVRRGLTNAQIAERLYLAESTVKSHLSSAFTKFGVRSRKEAAAVFVDIDPTLGAVAVRGEDPAGQAPA